MQLFSIFLDRPFVIEKGVETKEMCKNKFFSIKQRQSIIVIKIYF